MPQYSVLINTRGQSWAWVDLNGTASKDQQPGTPWSDFKGHMSSTKTWQSPNYCGRMGSEFTTERLTDHRHFNFPKIEP